MKGRKPKPIEQRIAEGNPGNRPLPEPLLIAGRPEVAEMAEPPKDLPIDGRVFWRDTVVRLIEIGMIDRVDRVALEMLATSYARWKQAGRVLAVDGHFMAGSAGTVRVHPAVRVERDAHTVYMRAAESFGLTPVARSRLGLAEVHRRTLEVEMSTALGAEVVDAEVVDGDVDLPGT